MAFISCRWHLFSKLGIYDKIGKKRQREIVAFQSQIKGKESENSYQELKRSRKGQAHINTRKLN